MYGTGLNGILLKFMCSECECYGLNVCVSSNSYAEIIALKGDDTRCGFWEAIRSGRCSSHEKAQCS